MQKDETSIP